MIDNFFTIFFNKDIYFCAKASRHNQYFSIVGHCISYSSINYRVRDNFIPEDRIISFPQDAKIVVGDVFLAKPVFGIIDTDIQNP